MNTCIYIYICLYVYMCICKYVYMYICVYVYMYICMCIYIYVYVYIYVYLNSFNQCISVHIIYPFGRQDGGDRSGVEVLVCGGWGGDLGFLG